MGKYTRHLMALFFKKSDLTNWCYFDQEYTYLCRTMTNQPIKYLIGKKFVLQLLPLQSYELIKIVNIESKILKNTAS